MSAAKMGVKLASSLSSSRLLQQSSARRLGAPAGRRASSTVVAAVGSEARSQLRERLPTAVAGLTLVNSIAPAAHADPSVDGAVASIVDIVKATGEVVKQGYSAAQTGAEYARSAYDQVAPVVREAVDAATPVVKEGVRSAVDAATPVLQSGLDSAGKALSSSGVLDTPAAAPLVQSTEQAVSSARPFLEQALNFVTTTEPVLLGQYAAGLIAAYYLAPPVLRAAGGLLKGYSGDVTAAAALSVLEREGDATIVDIRTAREKEAAGIPDIPNPNKLVELEYASIEDRKVRGLLRNVGELEIKVTALQISALKRLSPGSKVYLLDRSGGGTAKAVAKALAGRGYGGVYVIQGGFQGWQASKLRVKPGSLVSRVEVLPPGTGSTSRRPSPMPSRSLPAYAKTVSNRRALPSGTTAGQ